MLVKHISLPPSVASVRSAGPHTNPVPSHGTGFILTGIDDCVRVALREVSLTDDECALSRQAKGTSEVLARGAGCRMCRHASLSRIRGTGATTQTHVHKRAHRLGPKLSVFDAMVLACNLRIGEQWF